MDTGAQELLALGLVVAIVGAFLGTRLYRRRRPGPSGCGACGGGARTQAASTTRPLVFVPRRTRPPLHPSTLRRS